MPGTTTGSVKWILRIEGFFVLALSTFAYSKFGAGWVMFVTCFLLPDVSFIGYLAGPRAGACFYNAAHSYIGPLVCLAAMLVSSSPALSAAGLIWSAHIGFDRALGYGLKYAAGFRYTHLGLIGHLTHDAFNSKFDTDVQARRST